MLRRRTCPYFLGDVSRKHQRFNVEISKEITKYTLIWILYVQRYGACANLNQYTLVLVAF